MGNMIVFDEICLGVVLTSSLFNNKSQSSLVDETPGVEGILWQWSSFRKTCL